MSAYILPLAKQKPFPSRYIAYFINHQLRLHTHALSWPYGVWLSSASAFITDLEDFYPHAAWSTSEGASRWR